MLSFLKASLRELAILAVSLILILSFVDRCLPERTEPPEPPVTSPVVDTLYLAPAETLYAMPPELEDRLSSIEDALPSCSNFVIVKSSWTCRETVVSE